MTDPASIAGHCLCRAVTIEIDAPLRHVEICQCGMCRRWGGAFYAALSGAEARISGEDTVGVFRSSEWAERAFCRTCGTSLWFRFLPTGNRSFSAGLFDAATAYPVEREIFADDGACWTSLAGSHERRTGEDMLAEARSAGFEIG